jgi:hypothetical protein
MLRRASVLLGLAVLLSLLFPVQALLKQGGLDPLAMRLPVVDVAAACVVLAMLPALAMFRDAQLAQRIPRRSVWVALLALSSLLFVLLHVSWSLELATSYARDAVAGGALPAAISHLAIVDGLELAARLGVLVSLVGVLVRLDGAPQEESAASVPVTRGRKESPDPVRRNKDLPVLAKRGKR